MEFRNIRVTNLSLNLDNPRFVHQNSQLEAINMMIEVYQDQLYKLAVDILENGLNPSEKLLVIRHPSDEGKFIVLEGNRRITVLKILLNPDLIDAQYANLRKKFTKLSVANKAKLIHLVDCGICRDSQEANVWIERKHSNGMGVVGVQQWNAIQKQRFDEETKGKTSMSLQVVKMLAQSSLVSDDMKKQLDNLKITNLNRLMSDPDVRKQIGISLQNGRLTSDIKKEVVTKALVDIVTDMLNPDFKVSEIYNKEDRKKYMKSRFGEQGYPNTLDNKTAKWDLVESSVPQEREPEQPKKKKAPAIIKQRTSLVPKSFKLPILQPRLAAMFKELTQLPVKSYPNTAAIILRVFLEMSVDVYIETFDMVKEGYITSSSTRQPLKSKVEDVIAHLKQAKAVNKDITKGIEMVINNENSPLSTESLNSYVHNYRVSPIADNLITEWDNIQPFFESLWQAIAEKKGQEQ